jgi:2-aminoadipate transaminase
VEAKVAFVPGRPFYPKEGAGNTFRLNFSNQSEDRIKDGITRLGKILKSEL